jgi:hypothetical protein
MDPGNRSTGADRCFDRGLGRDPFTTGKCSRYGAEGRCDYPRGGGVSDRNALTQGWSDSHAG